MRTASLLLKCFIYDIHCILPDKFLLVILLFYFTLPSSLSHIFKHGFTSRFSLFISVNILVFEDIFILWESSLVTLPKNDFSWLCTLAVLFSLLETVS